MTVVETGRTIDHVIGPHTLPRWTEQFSDLDPTTVSEVLESQRKKMQEARITDFAAALTVHELREVRGKNRVQKPSQEIVPGAPNADTIPAPSRRIPLFRRGQIK